MVSFIYLSEDISITADDYLIPYKLTNFEDWIFFIAGGGLSMTVKSVLLLSIE